MTRAPRVHDKTRPRGPGASRSSDSGSSGRNAFPEGVLQWLSQGSFHGSVFRPSPTPLRVSSGFAPDSLTHVAREFDWRTTTYHPRRPGPSAPAKPLVTPRSGG
ncbi:hypothetical protein GCM10027174_27510 [Salinifilum aidingensis]